MTAVRILGLVAGIGLLTYLILVGIVKRGSDTIQRQQTELQRRLDQNLRLQKPHPLDRGRHRRKFRNDGGPGHVDRLRIAGRPGLLPPGPHTLRAAAATGWWNGSKEAASAEDTVGPLWARRVPGADLFSSLG